MATWLLPDNIADVLPAQAKCIEQMRRRCLDMFRSHGFELVEPPLIEFVDSLLSGTGRDLDNCTFKFMDQSNSRMIGIRADITPQIARIDSHILGRSSVSRLCYAGNCLHARPRHPLASRQPFVAGAELFGAAGLEADCFMIGMAVRTLKKLGIDRMNVDIGHTKVFRTIMAGQTLTKDEEHTLVRALRLKDPVALQEVSAKLPAKVQEGLAALLDYYGDISVLEPLKKALADFPAAVETIDEVRVLAGRCDGADVSVDFSDIHGYQYLTGFSFSVNIPGYSRSVLRGGRYDDIGREFGLSRPACGFTIYLRALTERIDVDRDSVIVADGPHTQEFTDALNALREEGKIVIHLLPGESLEAVQAEFYVTHKVVQTPSGIELISLK